MKLSFKLILIILVLLLPVTSYAILDYVVVGDETYFQFEKVIRKTYPVGSLICGTNGNGSPPYVRNPPNNSTFDDCWAGWTLSNGIYTVNHTDTTYQLVGGEESISPEFLAQSLSFFIGSITSVAFVLASSTRF